MEKRELIILQSLPLEVKIAKSKKRIREWIEEYEDRVYGSFSGGMGSTVLYRLVKEVELEMGRVPSVPFLFINTRNEFPEVVHHVYAMKAQNNEKYSKIVRGNGYQEAWNVGDTIEVRVSEKFQRDIFTQYGYLVGSKRTSRQIKDCRNIRRKDPDYMNNPGYLSRLDVSNKFSVPTKYQPLIDENVAQFEISNSCCLELKEREFDRYVKETGRDCPMTGEMAAESKERESAYLQFGCNGHDRKKPKSTPLGFWTGQDILEYYTKYPTPYPTCYGMICRDVYGKFCTSGEERTGCMCCLVPFCHARKGKLNSIQRMKRDYPKHYEYMMRSVEDGGLGCEPVVECLSGVLGINYSARPKIPLEELLWSGS